MFLTFFLCSIRNFSPKFENNENADDLPDYYNFLEEYSDCDFENALNFVNVSHTYGVLRAFSHRLCRKYHKAIILSSSYLKECNFINEINNCGCQVVTYKFLEKNGVPDINCYPIFTDKKKVNTKKSSKKNTNQNKDNVNTKQYKNENWNIKSKLQHDSQSFYDDNKIIKIKGFNKDKNIELTNKHINEFFKKDKKERKKYGDFNNYLSKKFNIETEIKDNEKYTKYSNENNVYCDKCQNDDIKFHLYKAKLNSTRRLQTITEMKRAIYERGPITATIAIDSNFKNYRDGIYTSSVPQTTEAGDYTIELIGWGKIQQQDFFINNQKIINYNERNDFHFFGQEYFSQDDIYYQEKDDIVPNLDQNNQYWIGLFDLNPKENKIIKILLGSNQGLIENFAYESEPE